MIGITLDSQAILTLANRITLASQRSTDVLWREVRDGTAELLNLLRSRQGRYTDPTALIHEVTGQLARTLVLRGPYALGKGTLEGRIVAGVFYAQDEIGRGGTHDYPARLKTTAEADGTLDAIAERIEQAIWGLL